jgi:hypothetical protein
MAHFFRAVVLVALLACGGCVTDLWGSPPPAATAGQATITITRSADDLSYMAAAATVELNGKEVAMLAMGRTYADTLSPGPAVIKVSAWSDPSGMASRRLPQGSTSYRFNVEAGKSYSFVVSPRTASATHNTSTVTDESIEGAGGPFKIAASQ